MDAIVFFALSSIVIAGALGVLLARNPVHSALFLVASMVAVAVLFATLEAHLLAVIQIVVYASAIVVLFLFVIMLLGVDRDEPLVEPFPAQRIVGLGVGVVLLVELLVLGSREWVTGNVRPVDDPRALDTAGGNVSRLAEVLFTDYFWAFQITSVMLVIAVVGAVVLARRSRPLPSSEDAVDPADSTASSAAGGA